MERKRKKHYEKVKNIKEDLKRWEKIKESKVKLELEVDLDEKHQEPKEEKLKPLKVKKLNNE